MRFLTPIIALFMLLPLVAAAQTILPGSRGGTGFATTTAGNATKCLSVLATNPITYTFSTCAGGGGGGGSGGWTFIPGAIYNSTTTDQVLIDETSTSTNAKLEVNGALNVKGAASSTSFTNSGTTWFTGLTSALLGTDNTGKLVATTSIGTNFLTAHTISGVELGGTLANLTATDNTLTFSGTYTGAVARTIGINLANPDTWTALQTMSAASTTNLTASNFWIIGQSAGCAQFDSNAKLTSTGVNCGTGSGGADAFTHVSVYGQVTSATSTMLALTGSPFSLVASSTVNFVNASTTNLTIFSNGHLQMNGITNSILGTDAEGQVTASTTIGSNLLSASGVSANSYTCSSLTVNAQGILTAASNGTCGSGINWPFTTGLSNFGLAVQSTTTPEWFQNGLMSSSTAYLSNTNFYGDINLNGNAGWLKVNSVTFAYASTSNTNTLFGVNALTVGTTSLSGNTNNSAFGRNALQFTTGSQNTAVGTQALGGAGTFNEETAVGYQSLIADVVAGTGKNTALGSRALSGLTTGINNTAVGYSTFTGLTTGSFNVGLGVTAGGSTGSNNVDVGYLAGNTGNGNVSLGPWAGGALTGNSNTFVGSSTAVDVTSGSNDVIIGAGTTATTTTTSNQLNIGNLFYGSGLYNGSSVSSAAVSGVVGIATNTPGTTFSVQGVGNFAPATSSIYSGVSLNGGLQVKSLNAASCDLKADTSGNLFCGTDAQGSGSWPFTTGRTTYSTTTQATTTPEWFLTGFYASSTQGVPSVIDYLSVPFGIDVPIGAGSGAGGDDLITRSGATFFHHDDSQHTIGIGENSPPKNSGGTNGIFIGDNAGDADLQTGTNNIAIGRSAAQHLLTASNNIMIGASAAQQLVSGSGNVILNPSGSNEGSKYGDNNIIIGQSGVTQTATGSVALNGNISKSYQLVIGTLLYANAINSTSGNLGIATSTPFWMLTATASTSPQIGLSDTTPGSSIWTLRSINNSLFFATSTALATSTSAAFAIDPNGLPTFASLKNLGCIGTDANGKFQLGSCSGGSGSWPFSPSTVYGQADQATSTLLALTGSPFSLVASSTVNFVNASTTNLTVFSNEWHPTLKSSILGIDNTGLMVASTTIGSNLLSASGVSANSYTNANITINAQGIVTAASNGSAGGSGAWPWFTGLSTYGTTTRATTTPEWFQTGFYASSSPSSPSVIDNLSVGNSTTTSATTTNLGFTTLKSALLSTNAAGVVVGTTTLGTNLLSGFIGNVNTTAPLGGGGALNEGGTLTLTCTTCVTSGPAWPFTQATTYGVVAQSTTTPFWFQGANGYSLFASSTAVLTNASTTNLSIFSGGNLWLLGTTSALLATNAQGLVVATTSIGYNYITGAPAIPTGANPTASAGLSAVNGVATTFMRSDAAPIIDQTILPTWTGTHIFSNTMLVGTSTPGWAQVTLASSTKPQLTLSDTRAADALWSFRANGSSFMIASSTALATSTFSALTLSTPTAGGYNILELWSATSTGPLFGVDQYGHVFASSTVPVLSSCGTTPSISADSSDFYGTITVGSVAATACTLSFGTPHINNTHCVISEQTGSITNIASYSESLTGFTYSQTGLTGDKLDYICTGN